ncbi:MAG: Arc/MetJ family transcription regulator [Candidatus Pelagisphaera sp.]|jgi:Arc/MetJ family transcription regulator
MKTTMDIDDKLLVAAKAAAARRRTTLKAMVEHALRREIQPFGRRGAETSNACFELSDRGLPQLKRRGRRKVTSELVYKLLEEEGI